MSSESIRKLPVVTILQREKETWGKIENHLLAGSLANFRSYIKAILDEDELYKKLQERARFGALYTTESWLRSTDVLKFDF